MTGPTLPDGLPAALTRQKMAQALRLNKASIDKLAPDAEATIPVAHIVAQATFHSGASEEALRHAMLTTLYGRTGFLSSNVLVRIFSTTFYSIEMPCATFTALSHMARHLYLRREVTQLLEPLAEAEGIPPHELVWQLSTRKRKLLCGRDFQRIYGLGLTSVADRLVKEGIPYIQIPYRTQDLKAIFGLAPKE